jgi:transcriptional regulator with XRE-family HTH domain
VKTPRLREWREAMGETQATLSERSGVAEHTISRIEHGASLRPTTARKLADALGVAVTDLMENPPALTGAFPKGVAPTEGAGHIIVSDEAGADGPQERRMIRAKVTDSAGITDTVTVTVSVRELQTVIEAVAAREMSIDQAMERLLAA